MYNGLIDSFSIILWRLLAGCRAATENILVTVEKFLKAPILNINSMVFKPFGSFVSNNVAWDQLLALPRLFHPVGQGCFIVRMKKNFI